MQVDLNSPTQQTIEKAARVIRLGGVVFYPSDTIYGLGCDPNNKAALQRIFEIKGRTEGKGMLVLTPLLTWVEPLIECFPAAFPELATRFWPGPVTFLLPARAGLSQRLVGRDNKLGVRCPDSVFLQAWMRAIPGPIVSTSANKSGRPPSKRISELRKQFESEVDLFLEAGDPTESLPSSVIDLTVDPPVLVRRGLQAKEIEESLGFGKG